MQSVVRTPIIRVADTIAFPVRALFMGPQGHFGLTSLRDERMWEVARYCGGRVLDVGCGPGNVFIKKFIGEDRGIGVDVYAYEGVENLIADPTHLPFPDESFDTVSLVAVVSHIPQQIRQVEFAEFARILTPGGRLVLTEGEPVTQWMVHVWQHFYFKLLGKESVDDERGMEEGEQYCMPRAELLGYLNTAPLRVTVAHSFQWWLNTVYVAEKVA